MVAHWKKFIEGVRARVRESPSRQRSLQLLSIVPLIIIVTQGSTWMRIAYLAMATFYGVVAWQVLRGLR